PPPPVEVVEPPLLRPLAEITADLSRPLPPNLLKTRKQGGQTITYIPWYTVNRLLDRFAPGWEGSVAQMSFTGERVFVVYSLTIPALEGRFTRQATGTEVLKELDRNGQVRELSFGDPGSRAESMAFRRAAARFGLGLYLYNRPHD
ncbi:Rad52/Rad22 family DNA repair protein, partial [Candidatus Cyanaurora vandensis]